MNRAPQIELIFAPGCGSAAPTEQMMGTFLEERGIDAEMTITLVAEPEDARRLRFLGSPTVRVNGVDVEPGADERLDFGLG